MATRGRGGARPKPSDRSAPRGPEDCNNPTPSIRRVKRVADEGPPVVGTIKVSNKRRPKGRGGTNARGGGGPSRGLPPRPPRPSLDRPPNPGSNWHPGQSGPFRGYPRDSLWRDKQGEGPSSRPYTPDSRDRSFPVNRRDDDPSRDWRSEAGPSRDRQTPFITEYSPYSPPPSWRRSNLSDDEERPRRPYSPSRVTAVLHHAPDALPSVSSPFHTSSGGSEVIRDPPPIAGTQLVARTSNSSLPPATGVPSLPLRPNSVPAAEPLRYGHVPSPRINGEVSCTGETEVLPSSAASELASSPEISFVREIPARIRTRRPESAAAGLSARHMPDTPSVVPATMSAATSGQLVQVSPQTALEPPAPKPPKFKPRNHNPRADPRNPTAITSTPHSPRQGPVPRPSPRPNSLGLSAVASPVTSALPRPPAARTEVPSSPRTGQSTEGDRPIAAAAPGRDTPMQDHEKLDIKPDLSQLHLEPTPEIRSPPREGVYAVVKADIPKLCYSNDRNTKYLARREFKRHISGRLEREGKTPVMCFWRDDGFGLEWKIDDNPDSDIGDNPDSDIELLEEDPTMTKPSNPSSGSDGSDPASVRNGATRVSDEAPPAIDIDTGNKEGSEAPHEDQPVVGINLPSSEDPSSRESTAGTAGSNLGQGNDANMSADSFPQQPRPIPSQWEAWRFDEKKLLRRAQNSKGSMSIRQPLDLYNEMSEQERADFKAVVESHIQRYDSTGQPTRNITYKDPTFSRCHVKHKFGWVSTSRPTDEELAVNTAGSTGAANDTEGPGTSSQSAVVTTNDSSKLSTKRKEASRDSSNTPLKRQKTVDGAAKRNTNSEPPRLSNVTSPSNEPQAKMPQWNASTSSSQFVEGSHHPATALTGGQDDHTTCPKRSSSLGPSSSYGQDRNVIHLSPCPDTAQQITGPVRDSSPQNTGPVPFWIQQSVTSKSSTHIATPLSQHPGPQSADTIVIQHEPGHAAHHELSRQDKAAEPQMGSVREPEGISGPSLALEHGPFAATRDNIVDPALNRSTTGDGKAPLPAMLPVSATPNVAPSHSSCAITQPTTDELEAEVKKAKASVQYHLDRIKNWDEVLEFEPERSQDIRKAIERHEECLFESTKARKRLEAQLASRKDEERRSMEGMAWKKEEQR